MEAYAGRESELYDGQWGRTESLTYGTQNVGPASTSWTLLVESRNKAHLVIVLADNL